MLTRLILLVLMVGLMANAAPTLAQTVTYCSEYNGPYADFSLVVPRYDIDAYAITNADVQLTMAYAGTLEGDNVDPLLECNFGFTMNPALETVHLSGEALVTTSDVAVADEIPAGQTMSFPFSGVFVNNYTVQWDDLMGFHADQNLDFVVPEYVMAFILRVYGDADFDFSVNLGAEVCVTYYYDDAVATESITYDAIKAMYR